MASVYPPNQTVNVSYTCFHCGDTCDGSLIHDGEKIFCCQGCLFVYQLLTQKQLTGYYHFDEQVRVTPKKINVTDYEYLDIPSLRDKIVHFTQGGICKVTLFLPQIHCTACIWLLENIHKLDSGIIHSNVHFLKKEASLTFDEKKTSLRKIAELLSSIGYEPNFAYDKNKGSVFSVVEKALYIKLGIAGFCFGNIMLLSMPGYLSTAPLEYGFLKFFAYLSFMLSLPLLYSLSDYFKSAWVSLRQQTINMDVPISIGVVAIFTRSVYELFYQGGPGYFDTLAGLAFFLIIGKIFQKKTFYQLSFDRDFRSYFPIAALRREAQCEKSIPIEDIAVGDCLIIRHLELIPADGVLRSDEALIDYSFVTGESQPVHVVQGERVFAGGKQMGGAIDIHVTKEVSRSYLTELWNQEVFKNKDTSGLSQLSQTIARYFTFAILAIAVSSLLFWFVYDASKAVTVFTSVLIVACGCGLPLSIPFTFGTVLRIFERHHLFLKNDLVVERMAGINTIVFDKTGTLTIPRAGAVSYEGIALSPEEKSWIRALVRQSTHPMSRYIYESIPASISPEVMRFEEVPGRGIRANIDAQEISIGSHAWVTGNGFKKAPENAMQAHFSRVYIAINRTLKGVYKIRSEYREGLSAVLSDLDEQYALKVLSGDHAGEKPTLRKLFSAKTEMLFKQLPIDKLNYIRSLQENLKRVMMIGDGLNDAGALKQSDVGIAITETTSSFTPSSDAILKAEGFGYLPFFIALSRQSMNVVYMCFTLIFLYNVVALSFAVYGKLTPLVAAIIMPVSSVSTVLFAVLMTTYKAKKLGFSVNGNTEKRKMDI
ncbi:heavy metal translocating P-type ATPase metal-binding domain-containing protein [bacterium]|nr:heavy metal translocating P-type ATPase metal-binding domain-containing protein [bacterium]